MSTSKEEKEKETEKSKRGRKVGSILFPRNSLNETLKVPQIIWESNVGEPLALLDIAAKLERSPTSSGFIELIRSSQRYGLTNESFTQDLTKTISLSPLGNSVVAPTPEEDVNTLKRKALETPELFHEIFSLLNGKIIPPSDSFKNMLIRTFHLEKIEAEVCYAVVTQNINQLGISEAIQGKIYLKLTKLGTATKLLVAAKITDEKGVLSEQEKKEEAEEKKAACPPIKVPWVFISHSKNKKIVDQIKQILDFGQFKYVVAEETETTAIPIPDKIFGLMRDCNSAIINISADEQEKKPDGTYGINANVLIEIGGAFLNYDRKVILLVDKRILLPSNLQGLYRSEYEGDELTFTTAMKLQKALTDFRKQ